MVLIVREERETGLKLHSHLPHRVVVGIQWIWGEAYTCHAKNITFQWATKERFLPLTFWRMMWDMEALACTMMVAVLSSRISFSNGVGSRLSSNIRTESVSLEIRNWRSNFSRFRRPACERRAGMNEWRSHALNIESHQDIMYNITVLEWVLKPQIGKIIAKNKIGWVMKG